jgi:transcriptional regulator with XRE-family HTH domain
MKKLRELRKSQGISMRDFGNIFGLAESTISLYETGKRQPDNETLLKFAKYFNVSTDYLLGNGQKNEPFAEAKSYSKEAANLLTRIDRLSAANRTKLSELIDLYLSSQDKKQ